MSEQSLKNPVSSVPIHSGGAVNERDEDRMPVFWRITIVFIAVTLVWLFVARFVDTVLGADYTRTTHTVRAALTSLLTIPLIVLARRFLDRRPWNGLGLTSLRTAWRPLIVGMLCWIIPATVGSIAAVLMGWTEITLQVAVSEMLSLAAGLVVLVFFYEALPEELIFRGYFYRNLASVMPLWMAVLGQAVLFTLWGVINGAATTLDRNLLFFMFSLILGVFRAITGSVWATIGFHLAFQTMAQLFGSIGNQFILSNAQVITVFAFGVLPFGVSLSILRLFYKTQPHWRTSDPDRAM